MADEKRMDAAPATDGTDVPLAEGIGLVGAEMTDDLSVAGIAADAGDAQTMGDGLGSPAPEPSMTATQPVPQLEEQPVGFVPSATPQGLEAVGDAADAAGGRAARRGKRRAERQEARHARAKSGSGSIVRRVAAVVGCLVLVALVATWAWGRARYSERLFPGRTVDGVDVGEMTAQEAADATSVERWSFTVDDNGQTYELDSDSVGFQTEDVDFAQIIADQDTNLWFVHVITPTANASVRKSTYDADKVRESVAALPCSQEGREAPVDAEARRTEDGKAYEIVPEREGNTVKDGVIAEAVEKALAEGHNGSINLREADAYVHPRVYADDESLTGAVETANRWMRTDITYDIDGLDSVERLGPDTIAPWVSVVREDPEADGGDGAAEGTGKADEAKAAQPTGIQEFGRAAGGEANGRGGFWQVADTKEDGEKDGKGESEGGADGESEGQAKPTFTATLDEDALRGWLAKIGEEYDTAGKPKTITTPTGKVAEVSGGGSYGWITDEASEFEAAKASIEAGETDHREFAMKQRAALPKGQNEWGSTYIEIDLSDQRLWYIRGGETVMDCGVITGKSGYETPTMVSQVYSKVTDTVLISPWKDPKTGEPTYKTHIDVGLVISGDGGILCHNAPWQPDYGFGRSSYHWSGGSHGCCNMRTGDCWELYNTASIGDPVIVHY